MIFLRFRCQRMFTAFISFAVKNVFKITSLPIAVQTGDIAKDSPIKINLLRKTFLKEGKNLVLRIWKNPDMTDLEN